MYEPMARHPSLGTNPRVVRAVCKYPGEHDTEYNCLSSVSGFIWIDYYYIHTYTPARLGNPQPSSGHGEVHEGMASICCMLPSSSRLSVSLSCEPPGEPGQICKGRGARSRFAGSATSEIKKRRSRRQNATWTPLPTMPRLSVVVERDVFPSDLVNLAVGPGGRGVATHPETRAVSLSCPSSARAHKGIEGATGESHVPVADPMGRGRRNLSLALRLYCPSSSSGLPRGDQFVQ